MQKSLLLGIGVIILIVVGTFGYTAVRTQEQESAYTTQEVSQQNPSEETNFVEVQSTGEPDSKKYRIYSPEIFEETAAQKRVLFFYANWCPTCKPADQDFSKNAGTIPANTVVIRVNYNDNETDENEKALAEQYGVTYQHTFVYVDSEGVAIKKWNGGQLEELLSNVQ